MTHLQISDSTYDLVIKFAQWLMANGQEMHTSGQLLAAARNRSNMLGKRVPIAWDNSGLTIEELRKEFGQEEINRLFTIPLPG